MNLYHGSTRIIRRPTLGEGNEHNDYGRGFYCTAEIEMAKEWACRENSDGFANRYDFDETGLAVLDLLDGRHTILNWIAILLQHRSFSLENEIAVRAKDYLIERFSVDVSEYDLVTGYRADDSYFSFARDFVNNALPLRSLGRAMRLGKLGVQYVPVSERAFARLTFSGAEPAPRTVYYPRFCTRDEKARATYRDEIRKAVIRDDLFVLDILREEIGDDDPRIQRLLP